MVFETMNDRGLELSATDLVKNHLFLRADDSMSQAERQWASMVGALESIGEAHIVKNFVRHYWISKNGPTRTQDLFGEMKDATPNKDAAMRVLNDLAGDATRYVALLNPMSSHWAGATDRTRNNLLTLGHLGISQIRPLLLAVMGRFSKRDREKIIRLAVSWSVRLLVTGEAGSGPVESGYGKAALKVTNGKIRTAKELSKEIASIIPADDAFEAAFATMEETKTRLARYYLRSLESQETGGDEPENVPNEDTVVTLEHILPQNPPSGTWKQFKEADRQMYTWRVGNLTLLKFSDNSNSKAVEFSEKRVLYANSAFRLTHELKDYDQWLPGTIGQRQKRLAKLAVKAWPL